MATATRITLTNTDSTVLNFAGVNFDRDDTPSFSGTLTNYASYVGRTVQIRDSLTTVGNAIVQPDGTWSFTFGSPAVAGVQNAGTRSSLTDGAHNINVRLADAPSVSASYKVTIDTQTTTPTAFASPAETYYTTDVNGQQVTHIITNTSYPSISGRGEPGAEINFFDRNNANPDNTLPADQQFNWIGSTVVDAGGNYTYQLASFNEDGSVNTDASTSLFPDGVYNIGITSTDVAGNYAVGPALSLEVDTVASSPFVYSLDTNAASNADGAAAINGVVFTNDDTPALKGYAETGSEVTVLDAAGNVLGTATADGIAAPGQFGKSEFTFQVDNADALSQGVHSFSFVSTDRAGNVSQPYSTVVGVDSITSAPTMDLAGTTTAGGVEFSRDNTPTISGFAEPGAKVAFTDGAGNTLGNVTANATTGAYSFTAAAPLTDGAKTITATATDALGNKATTTHDVTIDTRTAAPTIALDSPAVTVGGVTLDRDSTPTINGTAEAGSTVTIKDGNTTLGTTTAGQDGTYSFTPTSALSDGAHSLTVSALDKAGNVSAAVTQSVTVDTTGPAGPTVSLSVDTPQTTISNVSYNTDRTPTIQGVAEPGSSVTIMNGETPLGTVTAGADGAYSFTLAEEDKLEGDTYNFSVSATDLAGNTGGSTTSASFNVVCYVSGTRLQTQDGWKQVEQLTVGDMLQTVSGELQPVVWLGHSTIDCRRQQDKKNAYPVRIAQHAFGLNMPERDLFVSPLHSIYVEGVMIPAIHLVNGLTVTQEQQETLVTYYHVELPQHNAVLAEGLPAETYLDTTPENRHFFAKNNGEGSVFEMDLQFPACPQGTPVWQHIWDTQGYAPLTQSGPVLEAVKQSLLHNAQSMQEKQRLSA